MKLLKLDLMTVLIIVVVVGVIMTMTTQADDRFVSDSGVPGVSGPSFSQLR